VNALALGAGLAALFGEQRLRAMPALRAGVLAALVVAGVLIAAGLELQTAAFVALLLGVLASRRSGGDLRRRAARSRLAIEQALPDALDLLAGLVDAGAPLASALALVGDRIGGRLGAELEACAAALSGSGSRREAFARLRRSGSDDLARIGQALALADELGTGVADQLRAQALVQRDLRRSRARERAGTAAPKIALVIGLVLVPAALALVLGAELLSAFSTTGAS
jgi:tight adherence protein C